MEKEFTDDIEILLEYSSYEKTCNKTMIIYVMMKLQFREN
jgi:hypothetical protein